MSFSIGGAIGDIGNVGKNLLGNIFGTPAGQQPGTTNPFQIPDLDFLKNPVNLTGGMQNVASTDPQFQQLLASINSNSNLNSAALQPLLGQIDTNTKNAAGGIKSDFQDRGLGGPGQISDIEGNALAQNEATGALNKSNLEYGVQQQGAQALEGAYGANYNTANTNATTNANTFNDLLKTGGTLSSDQMQQLASLLSSNYTGAVSNQIKGNIPQNPGAIGGFFNNLFGSTGSSLGNSIGSGLASLF